MARYLVEVTVVMEMNDGGQGGQVSPDQFASAGQALISVSAHPWLVNSTIDKAYARSADIPGNLSAGVSPSEG